MRHGRTGLLDARHDELIEAVCEPFEDEVRGIDRVVHDVAGESLATIDRK